MDNFDKEFIEINRSLMEYVQKPLDEMLMEVRLRTPIRTGNLISKWQRETRMIPGPALEMKLFNRTTYAQYPAYYDRKGRRYKQGKKYYTKLPSGMTLSDQGSFTPVAYDIVGHEGKQLFDNLKIELENIFRRML